MRPYTDNSHFTHFQGENTMSRFFQLLITTFVAFVLVLGGFNDVWGQNVQFGPCVDQEIWLLPGEELNMAIQIECLNEDDRIVTLDYTLNNNHLYNHDGYYFFGCGSNLTETGNLIEENELQFYHFNWVANATGLNTLIASQWGFINHVLPNNNVVVNMHMHGNIIHAQEPISFFSDMNIYMRSIDGIRCDVNDDGMVTQEDIWLTQEYLFDGNIAICDERRYTPVGINVGRMITLFSHPTLLDCYLSNLWLTDPDHLLVINLGIGQSMQETAYGNSAVQPAPYSTSQVDNALTVETDGQAVAVFGTLADGTPWQTSGWTSNGQFNCELPEDLQNMRIEAVTLETSTDIGEQIEQPMAFSLKQNYPNPFNPTTTINFSLTSPGLTSLKVYNLTGSLVATLADGMMFAGQNSVEFDASALPSGTYFYTLSANGQTEAKKMVLLK
jgi:hypothetical protein